MGNDYYGDLKADFHREIGLLTRLRHPNIILFIGACRAPLCIGKNLLKTNKNDFDDFVIVTELAERGCLYDVIHQTPEEMTWNRVRSIAVCNNLKYFGVLLFVIYMFVKAG
jgi:serine/threonine protein kinase